MELISDFHVHSRYAGACSKYITLPKLEEYAHIKGVNLMGTGDFQHPHWFLEITKHLKEDENGILWSKTKFPFIWQTEISLVHTQDGKGRRVHHIVLAPNKEVVTQIIEFLKSKGRIDYDGRPMFNISSIEFADNLMNISKDIEIIPAHIWTSWYGIFGSKTGFDSVEECFQEKSKYIHALETGMSSDPAMNGRVSKLDKYNMVSFSDLHSFYPWRIGREATILDCPLTYKEIINAIRTTKGFVKTIETYPEYGKYHFDGHRKCNVHLTPEESKKFNRICPQCKRDLTIGVAYRVEELADREEGYQRKNAIPFVKLVPLTELISAVYGVSQLSAKTIWTVYNLLIKHFGDEYTILLHTPFEELTNVVPAQLAKTIISNREGTLQLEPGYDGVYGKILLDEKETIIPKHKQKNLGDF